jgi:phytoene desaturase (3,4-didehydrolycopene-forming)
LDVLTLLVCHHLKSNSTLLLQGHDAILVLVPCETLQRDQQASRLPRDDAISAYARQFDTARIGLVREAVLHRLAAIESLRDLKEWIVHEVVDTPATYADKYNVAAGSPFALSHGLGQLSVARPGAQVTAFPNVLHVGASARPGNGVPLVLIGAKLVADLAGRMLERHS